MKQQTLLAIGATASLATLVILSDASAQTIVNIPSDPAPRLARDGEIINVFEGGTLPSRFDALAGSQVNLLGGTFGGRFTALSGSLINIESGYVPGPIRLFGGSQAQISGARLERILAAQESAFALSGGAISNIQIDPGAMATLRGYDFKINGQPIAGLNSPGDQNRSDVPDDSYLTGIFADGTAFAFDGRFLADGTLTLTRTEEVTSEPRTFRLPDEEAPLDLRDGQRLIMESETARLPSSFIAGPGSTLEVRDGYVDDHLRVLDATVEVRAGRLGGDALILGDSTLIISGGETNAVNLAGNTMVNVTGGTARLRAEGSTKIDISGGDDHAIQSYGNSQVHISAGRVQQFFASNSGEVVVTGGNFLHDFSIDNTPIVISGGAFSNSVSIHDDSEALLRGFDFRMNGVPVANLNAVGDVVPIQFSDEDLFTGNFADGTPFAFTQIRGEDDRLASNAIRLERTAEPANSPATINVPGVAAPLGIRDGQTLTLTEGGVLDDNFNVGRGSRLIINGGTVGQNLEAVDAYVEINNGAIGRLLSAFRSTQVVVNGGSIGSFVKTYDGSKFTVNGGTVAGIDAKPGSQSLVNGGTVGHIEGQDVKFTITGGTVNDLQVFSSSSIEITGGETGGGRAGGIGAGSDSTVTVTGGNHRSFDLTSGAIAKIYDGRTSLVGGRSDTTIEIYGGLHGAETDVPGSSCCATGRLAISHGTMRLFGGAFGDEVSWYESDVELFGSDFRIDGVAVDGLENENDSVAVTLTDDSLFTGVLSDGTPFAFTAEDRNFFVSTSDIRLTRRTPPDVREPTISANSGRGPLGARAGQTVILEEGGFLDDNFVVGCEGNLIVRGGVVHKNLEAADGGEILIEGGAIGDRLSVLAGSTIKITGGTVGRDAQAYPGGLLHLDGGELTFGALARGGNILVTSGTSSSNVHATDGGHAAVSGGTIRELEIDDRSTGTISGGVVRLRSEVNSGGNLLVQGGLTSISADGGSTVEVTGGIIDSGTSLFQDANVTIRGGSIGDSFYSLAGSGLALYGTQFELDGTPISGLATPEDEVVVTIADDQLFSGQLADGSPFLFSGANGDDIRTVKLVRSTDPVAGPAEIRVTNAEAPNGVNAGQHLTVLVGGVLGPHFNAGPHSRVTVRGGSVGDNFEAYRATVSIEEGVIAGPLEAFAGSEVTISGGFTRSFSGYEGSLVAISGGSIDSAELRTRATARITGGHVQSFVAQQGSQTTWSGGTIATLAAREGSALEVQGANFRLNGRSISGLNVPGQQIQLDLGDSDILSATLADGTPILLTNPAFSAGSEIRNGALYLTRAESLATLEPAFIRVDGVDAPYAIGEGQQLQLLEGGSLPLRFLAGEGSSLEILGGEVKSNLTSIGSEVLIRDGIIGTGLTGLIDSHITVLGGEISDGLVLGRRATINLYGGGIPSRVRFESGTRINLFGSDFMLDGQPIRGLEEIGDIVRVTSNRTGQLLTGFLQDGSAISWRLAEISGCRCGQRKLGIDAGAAIQLHLVPEPNSLALASLTALVLLTSRKPRFLHQSPGAGTSTKTS